MLDVCKTLPGGNETKPGSGTDATNTNKSAAVKYGVGWGVVMVVAAMSVFL